MKRFFLAWTLAAFVIVACDDSGGTTSDTTDTSSQTDTSSGADTTGGGTTSAITGVNTDVSVTPPDESACQGPDLTSDSDISYPWGGFSWTDGDGVTKEFKCNRCPNGINDSSTDFQGKFVHIGFDSNSEPDPDTPDPSDYKEILYIDGNTFYTKVFDAQADGGASTVEARGYFFCSDKPDHPNKHLIWIPTQVTGTLKYAGEELFEVAKPYASDVVLGFAPTQDDGLLYWYGSDLFQRDTSVQYGYCREGGQVSGKTCVNRFAQ